jgi:hypothetical protein
MVNKQYFKSASSITLVLFFLAGLTCVMSYRCVLLPNTMAEKSSKDSLLSLIATGEFSSWHGLTQTITPGDMQSFFKEESSERSWLGESSVTLKQYRTTQNKNQLSGWFKKDTLLLIRIDHPAIKRGNEQLLQHLGTAPDTLPANPAGIYPFSTQLVYAANGITLYVNDKKVKQDKNFIEAISLYSSTTFRTYCDQLGGTEIIRIPPLKK